MKVLVVLELAVLLATTIAFKHTQEWEEWKMSHGKEYRNENDEFHRRTVWAKNKAFVEEHNKNSQKHGFIVELNKFADLVSTCMLNCCHECCSLHQNHVVRKMESSLESTTGTVKKHLAHKSKT